MLEHGARKCDRRGSAAPKHHTPADTRGHGRKSQPPGGPHCRAPHASARAASPRLCRAVEGALLHPRLGPRPTATFLAGLLVISNPLDVLREAFLLTDLLEATDHLLRGLVA